MPVFTPSVPSMCTVCAPGFEVKSTSKEYLILLFALRASRTGGEAVRPLRRTIVFSISLSSILALIGLLRIAVAAPAKSAESGWKELFNGRNLDGWEHVGPGGFTIEDGLLKSHGGMGLLWYTRQKFGKVVIRVVFKMQDRNDNSGIYIRIPIKPREAWMPVHYGYEVQIDNNPETGGEDDAHATGCLYSINHALARPGKGSGQWNTMEIRLDGPHTVVYVNSVKVTDYREGAPVPPRKFDFEPQRGPRPDEGFIGLQNHSDKDVVLFKEVAVRPFGSDRSELGR